MDYCSDFSLFKVKPIVQFADVSTYIQFYIRTLPTLKRQIPITIRKKEKTVNYKFPCVDLD